MLTAPVAKAESFAFGPPPEPQLAPILSPVEYDPLVYTKKLVDPEPIAETVFTTFTTLPEPIVLHRENLVKRADRNSVAVAIGEAANLEPMPAVTGAVPLKPAATGTTIASTS